MSELEDIKDTLRNLNHFSEEMLEWKGVVSTEIKYLKWLLGGIFSLLAGIFTVVAASFAKGLLGV